MSSQKDSAPTYDDSTFVQYLKSINGIVAPIGGYQPDPDGRLPELVIAFTRPQGTDNGKVLESVRRGLRQHGFANVEVNLADLLSDAADFFLSEVKPDGVTSEVRSSGFKRATALMRWGDFFRRSMTSYEMARFAITDIVHKRPAAQSQARIDSQKGVAYLVQNLMHPQEVELLRAIYRRRFFLVATHEPRDSRLKRLTKKFKDTHDPTPADHAELVVRIDAGDRPSELPDAFSADVASDGNALNINDTFQHADVFVDYAQPNATVERWMDQMFGNPWGTPTTDEFGMSIAFSSARSSAALGRSVGAAIFSLNESLAAVGWNDPAQPGGGVSKHGSKIPLRDHEVPDPGDPSEVNRLNAVEEILERLFGEDWESFYAEDKWPDPPTSGQQALREWLAAMREVSKKAPITTEMVQAMPVLRPLASARIFNLIEFGRTVHAEMAAITDASRRGVSTQDATIYVTTFPCHECARNIVAAGITRLVFVEPYAKSMTKELYDMSILNRTDKSDPPDSKVTFEPFLGISPRRFDELFSTTARKVGLNQAASEGREDVRAGQLVSWGSPPSTTLRNSILTEFPPGVGANFQDAMATAEDEIVGGFKDHLNRAFPWIVEKLTKDVPK